MSWNTIDAVNVSIAATMMCTTGDETGTGTIVEGHQCHHPSSHLNPHWATMETTWNGTDMAAEIWDMVDTGKSPVIVTIVTVMTHIVVTIVILLATPMITRLIKGPTLMVTSMVNRPFDACEV